MLTGKLPFPGGDILAIFHSLANILPPSPGRVKAGIPSAVSRLTMKLLEKNPINRFAKADDVIAEIDTILTKNERNKQRSRAATFAGSSATFWGMVVLTAVVVTTGIVLALSL